MLRPLRPRPAALKAGAGPVDIATMPDLKKALGELYDSPAPEPTRLTTSLDDDLAAALRAALVNAPAAEPAGPVAAAAPAVPPPSAMAGRLREFRRDALDPPSRPAAGEPGGPVPAPGTSASGAASGSAGSAGSAGVGAAGAVAALPGQPWRREDDDILPTGGAKSGRSSGARHRGRM
jgi:hypothetical protein